MKTLLFLPLLLSLVACNGPKTDSPADEVSPDDLSLCSLYSAPKDLAYPLATVEVVKNTAFPTISPTYNSGLPVTFRTTPQLPAGISISAVTGEILGTPTAAQALRSYELIAANECGTSVFPLTIKIKEIPPSAINYPNNTYSINIGDNFPVITPTVTGVADLYAVNPPLPAGMNFDEFSGTISGKPFNSKVSSSYVVTVSNSGGSKSTSIAIEIKGKAPSSLTYQFVTSFYKGGEDIANNSPLYSGEPATSFTISPALPEGLTLNAQTGVISGNPEVAVNNQQHQVTASNVWGSTNTTLSLSVLDHINDLATGVEHTCVVKNRKIYCQGRNDKLQLGYASVEICQDILSDEYACSKVMQPVVKNSTILKSKQLALGLETSCALGIDSKVYCWGLNDKGQTGTELNINKVSSPTSVKISGVDLSNITKIKAGYNHFCALNSLKELYCWGDNSKFQLSSPVLVYSNSPIKVEENISDFALGANHSCVLKNSLPYCVGSNQFYQLANGLSQDASSFVLAQKMSGSFSTVSNLWAGSDFSIFKEADEFFASGLNSQGELGLDLANSYSKATVILNSKAPSLIVSGGAPSQYTPAVTGAPSLCYIENGFGFCQGRNDNNFANPSNSGAAHSTPLEILSDVSVPFVNIEKISQGYSNHRCLSRNGTLFCFGQNYMGQVSNDTDVVKEYPVPVTLP